MSRCQYWIEYSIDPRVSIIACAKDRWPPWPMLPPPSWLSYTLHSLYIVHSTLSLCTVTTHTVPVCICTSIGFAQEDMHNFAQFSFTGMLSMSTCVQRLTVQWYNVPCAQFCMNRADGSLVTLLLLLHLHSPSSWTYTHTCSYTYTCGSLVTLTLLLHLHSLPSLEHILILILTLTLPPPSSLEPSGSRMGKTFNSWSLNRDQIDYCSTCLLR